MARIPEKYLEYEFQEQRLLRLATPLSGNTITANQRCYFGPNSKLMGKRIVAIDIMAKSTPFIYDEVSVIAQGVLVWFTLTIVNQDGHEIIKNMPVADLHRLQTTGKIRIFDVMPDLEKSYVIPTANVVLSPDLAIMFQFFTVSW